MSVDLRRDLEKILPQGHPFFESFDRATTPVMEITKEEEAGPDDGSTDYLNLVDEVVTIIHVIDDWKRGIRDWDEVERALDEVRPHAT